MSNRTIQVDDRLYGYLRSVSLREPDVLKRLRAETAQHTFSGMQIGPEQGQFMAFLVEALGVRRALEIGVFTGYSSTVVALAMPPEGRIVACDVSEEFTQVARRYWREAGVEDRIELRLGPGADTLRSLPTDASLDLAFIDADKTGYAVYWDEIVPRTRPGGIILVDNTFMHGRIFDDDPDPDARAVRDFNEHALADDRVELAMLSVGDGLIFARKK